MRRALSIVVVVVVVAALAGLFALWEFGSVCICDGRYDITVIIRSDPKDKIANVWYTGLSRRELVPLVVEHYPQREPTFTPVEKVTHPITVPIGFGVRCSPLGREWGYGQEFEVLLFRVEFEDGRSVFQTIDVPRRDQAREVVLDLADGR